MDDPPDFQDFLDRAVRAGHFDNIDFSSTANNNPVLHLLFDGCSAAQTCKKVLLESAYHGVFSFVLVNAAQGNPSIIWRQLRDSVEAVIVGRFFQNPHLEGPDFLKYRTIFI